MDPTSRLASELRAAAKRTLSMEQATVTGTDPLRVEGVDGDVELSALGWYDPAVGDQVTVVRMGTTGIVLGASVYNQRPSDWGTVTAYDSGTGIVTVTVDGRSYAMPRARGWTPTVDEVCAVMWSPATVAGVVQWSGVAMCGLDSAPTPATVPKVGTERTPTDYPPMADEPETIIIPALSSGTWRSGAWRTDTTRVIQGEDPSALVNSGYWFYGNQMAAYRDLIVSEADIWLHAGGGGPAGATAVNLLPHGDATKTDTQPTTTGGALGTPALADGASGWYPLNVAAVQRLVDGIEHGVCCLSTSPADYSTLLGLAGDPRDPMSGALRIKGGGSLATVLFSDDFNRADSTTVGNGWTRYHPGWGGGIVSGALAVVDDYYDWFERVIPLTAPWTASWTIASTSPDPARQDWIGFDLYADTTATNWIASVGFGAGTSGGDPKTVWVDARDRTSADVNVPLPGAGDVVSASLDASGTFSASINGVVVSSMASSGIGPAGYIGLSLVGTGTGTVTAIDDFTITTP